MSTAPRAAPRALPRALLLALALAGCAPGAAGLVDPREAGRRGATELAVKADHPAVLLDIAAGGGPALDRAFDAAGVPPADRPARALQLRGDLRLHEANPGALVAALVLYGR